MKAKSCRSGYYWCFDDKKCKKIPLGYHIGARGYLYPDKDDDGNSDGNGNGKNGNGNGGNNSGSTGNNGGSGSGVSEGTTMQENFKRINQNGQTYAVMLQFRGRTYNIQMFIPRQTRPTRLEVQKEVNKIYPGAIVRYFEPRVWDPANPALVMPEQMQPGAKDLVQQSDYMKPALQQKPKKKKHTCGEGVTLKKVSEIADPLRGSRKREFEKDKKNQETKDASPITKVLDSLKPKPVYAETLTYDIDPKKHRKERRDAKIGNLARKTTNPGEKSAAEKKSKGPKLFGEDTVRVEGQLGYVEFIDIIKPEPMKGIAERKLTKGEEDKKEDIVKGMKKSFKGFRDNYGPDAKSVMYATATKLAKEEVSRGNKPSNVKKKKKLQSLLIDKEVKEIKNSNKKKKKHNCASKVKHEEYGIGKCISGMHDLDESGNVAHYDVEFENIIVENVPVKDLEILVTEMHEHVIRESVQNGKVDLVLKKGVNNVLKQDNEEYDRGLLARVNEDGSYDVAYWYDKYKAYPVEVEIDGKTCAKDAKNIHIKFHPELKKEEVELDERLGGKGYKPYTSLTGQKVSGDWEDSDRGAGNKAKKRAGGKVEKKSPTYQAYVHNKIKEQLAPHIKKGVAAAKPLVKAQALQTGLPTTKEKPKPPEKKDSKSIFSQLTNKDEID